MESTLKTLAAGILAASVAGCGPNMSLSVRAGSTANASFRT